MRYLKIWALGILLISAAFTPGCASPEKKVLKAHDDLLLYALPFDLTYLRTLEALELVPGWELEETEKEKGMIRMRNVNFSRWDDSDKQYITFMVKRIGTRETSVQVAPESQYVPGGRALLDSITAYMNVELEKQSLRKV